MTRQERENKKRENEIKRRIKALHDFCIFNDAENQKKFEACNSVMERDNLQKQIIKDKLFK